MVCDIDARRRWLRLLPTCNQLPNIGTDRGPGGIVEECFLEDEENLSVIRTKMMVAIAMERLDGEKGIEK